MASVGAFYFFNTMHFYSENPLGEIESHDLTQSKGHKLGYYASVTSKLPSDPERLQYMWADNILKAYLLGLGKRASELLPYSYGFVSPEDTFVCEKHTPVSEWGTEGHRAIEEGLVDHPAFGGHVRCFHEWLEREGFTIVEQEKRVLSHELKLGGTIDLILLKKNEKCLADFKFRGKSMQSMRTDGMQLALYSEMEPDVEGCISLIFNRLEPELKPKIWSKKKLEDLKQIALAYNHAYNLDAEEQWG